MYEEVSKYLCVLYIMTQYLGKYLNNMNFRTSNITDNEDPTLDVNLDMILEI